MIRYFLYAIIYVVLQGFFSPVAGQQKMFRLYEENDFLNFHGRATDEAYTNGTRIDFFKEAGRADRFFLNRWMPEAGAESVNTFGWSIMQLIYTPVNIRAQVPDQSDNPYAGALFLIRSLRSENRARMIRYQTEVMAGLTGPYSFARETQRTVHRLTNDPLPEGWHHQIRTNLILNIDFTAEKQYWKPNRHIDISGAVNFKAGTLWTGISSYTVIRTGKINDLFNGFINHYHSAEPVNEQTRFQFYALLKPGISYNLKNTLISGGLFEAKGRQKPEAREEELERAIPRKIAYGYDYGFVISVNKLSLEITQKVSTADIRGNRKHEVGNISIYKVF